MLTVLQYQTNLRHYNYYYKGALDGINGAKTKQAVRLFQAEQGLVVDGIYGPKTDAALVACIKKLQRIVGVAQDGIVGVLTIAAIKAKQKAWGLVADGLAGPKFWAKANGGSSSGSTSHFAASEFKCGCGGRYCNGYPAGSMNSKLLSILESLRAYYGKPITITSGQRCTTYNRLVGGISNSSHKTGKAADFYIPGICDTAAGRSQVVQRAYAYSAAYAYANTSGMGNAVHINV